MPITYKSYVKKNGLYGPTANKRYYEPAGYHNQNAEGREKDKTLWCLSEPHQYCVFKYADENKWYVEDLIKKEKLIIGLNPLTPSKLETIGQDGEKVAIFRLHRMADEIQLSTDGMNVNKQKRTHTVNQQKIENVINNTDETKGYPVRKEIVEIWHGYPVKLVSSDNNLDELFVRLRDNNVINKAMCRRLVEKKRI